MNFFQYVPLIGMDNELVMFENELKMMVRNNLLPVLQNLQSTKNSQAFRWGELTNKVASKVTAYFWLPFNIMGEKLLQYNHGGFLVCLVCQEICAKCCHDNFVIISYIMWNYKLALKFCAKIKAWVTCHPWMLNN